MPRPRASRSAAAQSPLVIAAERLTDQIADLIVEVEALRADNEALRTEVREAVALVDGAATSLSNRAGRTPRRRTRGRAARGRATPPEVTADVVRAVLAKLGPSTAGDIAAEISRAGVVSGAGVRVSGRAVRHLAERAGARIVVDADGKRRYSL